MVPSDEVVAFFVDILDKFDPPRRMRKFSNRDVLNAVFLLLNSGMSWRDLNRCNISASAVYKRYNAWVKNGIIRKAWAHLLGAYASRRLKDDPKWFGSIFIDTTMVKNIQGNDCIGKNPTDRGRAATKLSLICDNARIPISATFHPANNADVSVAEETVSEIQCPIRRDTRYKNILIGDKGYASVSLAARLMKSKIELLTPVKRRSKQKRTAKQKQMLKQRYRIENVFCRLDKFKRIHLRRDQSILSFEAMHHLAFCVLLGRELVRQHATDSSKEIR